MRKALISLFILAMAWATPASAQYTFNVDYFRVTAGGDFTGQCCGNYTNMIQNALGPNGMPVVNLGYGGPTLTDVNSGTGELTWWNPALNSRVTATGSGIATNPVEDFTFFPPNGDGGNNANGFLTAIFSGVITLAADQTVNFTFGGDDDIFLFVDDQVVGQLGGVHGYTEASPTTSLLSAGSHTFKAFYADRERTDAAIRFRINTADIVVTPGVPEPATWALLLIGFGAIGATMRTTRRKPASLLAA